MVSVRAAPAASELERAEILAMEDFYAAEPRDRAAGGAVVERIGGATVLAIPGARAELFNRVVGLGVGSRARPADIDAALEAVSARSERWSVSVAPHAQPSSLLESLIARGLRQGYAWMKFRRGAEPPPPVACDLAVRRVGADEAGTFASVVTEAYELPATAARQCEALPGRARWHCFVAFEGDVPVAGATLFVADALAWFGLAATLPAYRGRGAQSALLAARIRAAAAAGATTLVVETGERVAGKPDASYRNLLRFGFREAYLRPNLSPG